MVFLGSDRFQPLPVEQPYLATRRMQPHRHVDLVWLREPDDAAAGAFIAFRRDKSVVTGAWQSAGLASCPGKFAISCYEPRDHRANET
jgi:hypothetical protein